MSTLPIRDDRNEGAASAQRADLGQSVVDQPDGIVDSADSDAQGQGADDKPICNADPADSEDDENDPVRCNV